MRIPLGVLHNAIVIHVHMHVSIFFNLKMSSGPDNRALVPVSLRIFLSASSPFF